MNNKTILIIAVVAIILFMPRRKNFDLSQVKEEDIIRDENGKIIGIIDKAKNVIIDIVDIFKR